MLDIFCNSCPETQEDLNFVNTAMGSIHNIKAGISASTTRELANQSTHYLKGVATDLSFKVRSAYIPTDFMILDMGNAEDTPLILGRPFLNTTNACIYVASRKIQFHSTRRKEIFAFASGQPLFDEK